MTEKEHLRNNTYRSSRTRARKKINFRRTEVDELPSFVDPKFDDMDERETDIVERIRGRFCRQTISD